MDYRLNNLGSVPWSGGFFLFTTEFSLVLGPTQSPIQWVLGSLSVRVKRPGNNADHSLPCSAEDKNGRAILSVPHMLSWHSAVLIKQWDNFTCIVQSFAAPFKSRVHKRRVDLSIQNQEMHFISKCKNKVVQQEPE
jgi:hypothetical protein